MRGPGTSHSGIATSMCAPASTVAMVSGGAQARAVATTCCGASRPGPASRPGAATAAAASRRAASCFAARPASGGQSGAGARGQHPGRRGDRQAQRGRAGEPAAGRRRPGLADQDGPRRVVPPRRDHLGLVHAQPDDEVGRAEQRPLHRAAGDQPGRLGGGIRQHAAGPVGVQRRDTAPGQRVPDRRGCRYRARAEQHHRPPRPPHRLSQHRLRQHRLRQYRAAARAAVFCASRSVWASTPFSTRRRRAGRPDPPRCRPCSR